MKKSLTLITAILLSVVAILSFGKKQTVLADDDTPVVTLGTSLTESQKQGTLKTLTAPLNGGNYQTITVTGSDLVKYLNPSGDNFTTSSGVWSSAMIQKTNSGSGINVKILDYNGKNNITTITANQYKNAALTAGITDANIYVTSAIPIDGSGALAGVYAAYAKNGNALNQKQVNAAQDEMNTLSGITQDNKGKKGYSDAQLNNAVAGAKSEMAKQGQNISDSQIRDIVNNQININHLGNTINNNQKNQIINLLIEIRDSGALKNGDFKGQAAKLSNQIENGAKNIFNKFNTPENRNLFQQIWDSIVNFFSGLFK
ncbi:MULTISPECIES: DUF1002 domain-containing protein [Lactobacillus]|jgi:uncharacterized protein YpuA (DUF1002 family)|uniref:Extracellular protein n=1 Tax=Lactobacillus gallinarum DSM 10532 = JCM 2011 TaxID=1423748 RepID=A0A0R1NLM5_9LACO|nr:MULTISPECIES: DUF1002 domain-containing protein [Lactobacillus]NMB31717.1 DUF1002 domain-containing protein [Lactobacillus sp.]KRL21309.1 extracellular protein [Lactobacillus gallinarum DSM 10532 = JCM 2011]MBM6974062.1 DUF1002 domain-containing protein [Lactobacillus gallinarum]MDM8276417.1 DUF1002 domain-containing protein [Lactobacillus gallinarum]MDM8281480.1 DUF1002 domain-containing protein [Lactobacillus gallinarum]